MRNSSNDQNDYWNLWNEAKKAGKPMPLGTREAPLEPMKFGLDSLVEGDRKRLNMYGSMQEPQPILPLPKVWLDPDGTLGRDTYSDEEAMALAAERVAEAGRLRAAEKATTSKAETETKRRFPFHPSSN